MQCAQSMLKIQKAPYAWITLHQQVEALTDTIWKLEECAQQIELNSNYLSYWLYQYRQNPNLVLQTNLQIVREPVDVEILNNILRNYGDRELEDMFSISSFNLLQYSTSEPDFTNAID